MARGLNKMIVSQLEKPDDDELAKRAWASTMEEIDMQWVWLDDTSEVGNFLLAKRFPLEQKQKLRIIDDCTAGGLNQTCGSQDKLKIHAIDEFIAYLSWSIAHYGDPLVAKLVGKTFDLTSAYKQYGISQADRELLRIATWDPHQRRVRLLGVNALPFGASGSVASFLRVGMAIWFVGFYWFGLVTLTITRWCLGSRVAKMLISRLKLCSNCLESLMPEKVSSVLNSVGRSGPWGLLCLEGSSGCIEVGHIPERRQELADVISSILEEGSVTVKLAESLRGRLQWFETFAFGRTAQKCLRRLSESSLMSGRVHQLSQDDRNTLVSLKDRVWVAPPVVVRPQQLDTWCIFTDGACEAHDATGGVGGVIMSPDLTVALLVTFPVQFPQTSCDVCWKKVRTPFTSWRSSLFSWLRRFGVPLYPAHKLFFTWIMTQLGQASYV